jgi:hypothetical protein
MRTINGENHHTHKYYTLQQDVCALGAPQIEALHNFYSHSTQVQMVPELHK